MIEHWTQQFKILNHNTSLQALNHLKKKGDLLLVLIIIYYQSWHFPQIHTMTQHASHHLLIIHFVYILKLNHINQAFISMQVYPINMIKSLNTLGSNHIILLESVSAEKNKIIFQKYDNQCSWVMPHFVTNWALNRN